MIFTQPVNIYAKPVIAIVQKKEEPKKHEPLLVIVKEGDTLTSIAQANNTTIERLFDKNLDITDPNQIKPSQTLTIPLSDEVLKDRPLPVTISSADTYLSVHSPALRGAVSSSGNLYTPGFCTFYAKERRPDLPNNLGNADTWYARYIGAKGSEPRAGAIAAAINYMHVAYVERVNGDGTILISEENYQGYGIISSRTAPASEFLYLY